MPSYTVKNANTEQDRTEGSLSGSNIGKIKEFVRIGRMDRIGNRKSSDPHF
jgi:hypothetical protein